MSNLLEKEICQENLWELWKASDINLVQLFFPHISSNGDLEKMNSQAPLVFEEYNFSASLAYIFRLEQSDSISLGQRQEYSVQSYFSKNYAEKMRKK